ncbi:trihydrophobin-like [Beta vulgaris subsp. vulgaris]|uniref:trihydrophobin-like n=1 Tax=Beta vulgaris subsp. vulgaris TaxID=3555 RepID=UPI002549A82A|nr:trihydrophobin-like [Beta vulgaris subsp. vulgaris]
MSILTSILFFFPHLFPRERILIIFFYPSLSRLLSSWAWITPHKLPLPLLPCRSPPFPITFDDLRPKLLLHEQRLKSSKDASDPSSHHALLAVKSTSTGSPSSSQNNSGGRNRGRNNRNRGGNNTRGGNNARNNNGWHGGHNNNRGSGGNNNNNGNRGRSNGHQAAYCPQRFNHNFVPSSSESVTRALAALSVGGESNDSVWYPDLGAASHMTPQDGPDNGGSSASGNQ